MSQAPAKESFDRSAGDYDDLLLRNRHGAARLVAAVPDGEYRVLLDVGAGTGFAAEEALDRFPLRRLIAVDPSEPMLARLAAKLGARPGLDVELHPVGVERMDLPAGVADLALSAMAFHWFPDKPGAIAAMARATRAGGVVGILASGRGTDEEFRQVLGAVRPAVPEQWTAVFDLIHRDVDELADMLRAAGLEPIDVWEERRRRRVAPDAFLDRINAVASHLSSRLDPEEVAAHAARVRSALHAAAGPQGFEYSFVKLFAVARRP